MYPALAVVGALVARRKDIDVLWIGGEGGMEASLVARAGIDFESIPAAGLHGVDWRALPGNVLRLAKGYLASRSLLRRFKPDVLFYTGGYLGVPVAFAGRGQRQAMYVPDIEPALALRWIARWVQAIAVTSEKSRDYYDREGLLTVTGYPTRAALKPIDKELARTALGLSAEVPTILVFGGSRGARSINQALWQGLLTLLKGMQIIHITGQLDWGEVDGVKTALPLEYQARYLPFAYLHDEMSQALSAVDLVVSRAGAAVLGEYPLYGLPAILVPYPHAWRYQWVNARYLEQRGAAQILKDQDLQLNLVASIQELMGDDRKREQMAVAMRALHTPEAANKIASILINLGQETEAIRG